MQGKNATTAELFKRIKGVIPAAGLGTRMRPLTMVTPKELLPVQSKPMIQWALEEAILSGLYQLAVVLRKGKEPISDFIEILKKIDDSSGESVRAQLANINLQFVFQEKPLGLGDALYQAREFIGDSPFVMILPDQLFFAERLATLQLLTAAVDRPDSVWSSLADIPESEIRYFPGARSFKLSRMSDPVWRVLDIDNGDSATPPSTRIGFGRTYFPSGTVKYFSDSYLNPQSGEVDLLFSFKALIRNYSNYALQLDGQAMDFGTWPSYLYFNSKLSDHRVL